jgi:TonB family protein
VKGERAWLYLAIGVAIGACGGSDAPAERETPPGPPPEVEPPVALNADSPVSYPPALFDQRIEGDVLLRLFVDSTGKVAPESTRVIESSGYPALDSAALAGSRTLRYAPGKRRGIPVATTFVQPIEFRHPQGAAIRGGP